MTKDYFITLADYNVWANDMVHSWFDKLSDEQWEQTVNSSFPSLSATALHIAGTETIWLDRLNNVAEPRLLAKIIKNEKIEIQQSWKESSQSFRSFVKNFDENRLNDVVGFKRLDGKFYELQYHQIFAHVFNHSTYHRGQIVTILRQVGFTGVASTDLSTYFWNKKN